MLLTVVTMLYIASLGLNLFLITESLYLLTPFTTSPTSQPPPLATTSLFSVSQFGYLVLFLSNSVHKWDHTVFVFFSVWLSCSPSIMPSRSTHVVTSGRIFFFFKVCFFFLNYLFGCAGFSLLCRLFSSRGEQGRLSSFGAWATHCGGFSRRRVWASVVVAPWALEHRLSSCGPWVY